jgi:hypothetical protein
MGKLRTDNGKISTDNGKLRTDKGKQRTDNGKLKTDNGKLRKDNGKLRTDNGKLKTDNGKLRTDNGKLRTDNGKLRTDNCTAGRIRFYRGGDLCSLTSGFFFFLFRKASCPGTYPAHRTSRLNTCNFQETQNSNFIQSKKASIYPIQNY